MGQLADVDLRREVTADRTLERFPAQDTTGEGPSALEGRERPLPEQYLEGSDANLEHDCDGLLRVGGRLRGRFSIHSRKLAKGLR
jgi:hypothetical protein